MKFNIKYLPYIIIAGLLVYIFMIQECGNSNKPIRSDLKPDTAIKVVYIPDTVETVVYKSIFKPQDTIFRNVPIGIDTDSVLKDHYTQFIDSDTTIDSNNFKLIITDNYLANRRLSRHIQHFNLKPIKEITKTITVPVPVDGTAVNKLFIGGHISYSPYRNSIDLGPNVSLVTKRDNLYRASYSILDKSYTVGIEKKLSFRKK